MSRLEKVSAAFVRNAAVALLALMATCSGQVVIPLTNGASMNGSVASNKSASYSLYVPQTMLPAQFDIRVYASWGSVSLMVGDSPPSNGMFNVNATSPTGGPVQVISLRPSSPGYPRPNSMLYVHVVGLPSSGNASFTVTATAMLPFTDLTTGQSVNVTNQSSSSGTMYFRCMFDPAYLSAGYDVIARASVSGNRSQVTLYTSDTPFYSDAGAWAVFVTDMGPGDRQIISRQGSLRYPVPGAPSWSALYIGVSSVTPVANYSVSCTLLSRGTVAIPSPSPSPSPSPTPSRSAPASPSPTRPSTSNAISLSQGMAVSGLATPNGNRPTFSFLVPTNSSFLLFTATMSISGTAASATGTGYLYVGNSGPPSCGTCAISYSFSYSKTVYTYSTSFTYSIGGYPAGTMLYFQLRAPTSYSASYTATISVSSASPLPVTMLAIPAPDPQVSLFTGVTVPVTVAAGVATFFEWIPLQFANNNQTAAYGVYELRLQPLDADSDVAVMPRLLACSSCFYADYYSSRTGLSADTLSLNVHSDNVGSSWTIRVTTIAVAANANMTIRMLYATDGKPPASTDTGLSSKAKTNIATFVPTGFFGLLFVSFALFKLYERRQQQAAEKAGMVYTSPIRRMSAALMGRPPPITSAPAAVPTVMCNPATQPGVDPGFIPGEAPPPGFQMNNPLGQPMGQPQSMMTPAQQAVGVPTYQQPMAGYMPQPTAGAYAMAPMPQPTAGAYAMPPMPQPEPHAHSMQYMQPTPQMQPAPQLQPALQPQQQAFVVPQFQQVIIMPQQQQQQQQQQPTVSVQSVGYETSSGYGNNTYGLPQEAPPPYRSAAL